MTFRTLYFILIGVLTGILAWVLLGSSELSGTYYGSSDFDAQVSVSRTSPKIPEQGYFYLYSEGIHRRRMLPIALSGIIVIAIAAGLVMGRVERKQNEN